MKGTSANAVAPDKPVAPIEKVASGTPNSVQDIHKNPIVDNHMPAANTMLPPSLMKDAYSYYGLSGKSIDLQLVDPQDGSIRTGSVTSQLMGVSKGVATYQVKRTGQLGKLLGNDTVELRSDGVYDTGTTKGTLKSPALELPNDLNPGKTWKYVLSIITSEGTDTQNIDEKIVGVKPLVTPLGTLQALVVHGVGTETVGNLSTTVDATSYYVKDLGIVEFDETIVEKGKKPIKISLTPLATGKK